MTTRLISLARALAPGAIALACLVTSATDGDAQRGFAPNRVDGVELRVGGKTIWSNPTFLSSQSLCSQLYAHRADLEKLVYSAAGEASAKLPRGMNLVRQKFDLSPGCTAQATVVVDQIAVNVSLPRSIFFTNVTTPTFLGQAADPRFSVDFDVTAGATVKIPSTAQAGLELGAAKGRVFNIKPDGQNFTGDISIAVARFVDHLADLGFAAKLAHGFDLFQFKGAKLEFGKLADVLKQQGANPKIRHHYDSSRRVVVLELVPIAGPSNPHTAQQNWDRPGSDYLKFATKAASECEAACGRNTMCRAWTWVRPGVQGPNAQCYLKNGVPNAVASTCCTSGVRPGVRACPSGLKGPNCDELDVR